LIDDVLGPVEPAAAGDDRAALAEAAAAPEQPAPLGASPQLSSPEPINANASVPRGDDQHDS